MAGTPNEAIRAAFIGQLAICYLRPLETFTPITWDCSGLDFSFRSMGPLLNPFAPASFMIAGAKRTGQVRNHGAPEFRRAIVARQSGFTSSAAWPSSRVKVVRRSRLPRSLARMDRWLLVGAGGEDLRPLQMGAARTLNDETVLPRDCPDRPSPCRNEAN
jgi:hypothetical protein